MLWFDLQIKKKNYETSVSMRKSCGDANMHDKWFMTTNINYVLLLFVWCLSVCECVSVCVCALSPFMIKCVRNVTYTQTIPIKFSEQIFLLFFFVYVICMHPKWCHVNVAYCATTVAYWMWMSIFSIVYVCHILYNHRLCIRLVSCMYSVER